MEIKFDWVKVNSVVMLSIKSKMAGRLLHHLMILVHRRIGGLVSFASMVGGMLGAIEGRSMTCRIKKAKKQRELDELVFNVLVSLRHHGAMQWVDWHEIARAKRGERGLGHSTFANAVKRLVGEGRARRDGDGCYLAVYDVEPGLTIPGSGVGSVSGSVVPDKAAQALEQLLNRKLPRVV